ncbi:hypothetical protein BHF68_09775 [Desulfuribacillus alkaliarsenatis]|uniref:4-hydroxy-3-methylbut-2-enyl diphosphate reductase n=1 Tax=Desulfuribacillus alkaliarsenatis TaxID=766136 RepID=A0A1E5FZZ3_9FIRM|nr:hypothetical protein BHF68_09775 [Desulfuribacillus alkaliarsenatis]
MAQYAGFCKGVKRAIDTAKDIGNEYGKALTLGPIVHNQFVVDYLAQFGVGAIDSIDYLDQVEKNTAIVLRSHGVGKAVYDRLEKEQIQYVDATCPFVKAVHKLAYKAYTENKDVIIVGDPTHPEVIGILGWTDNKGYVLKNADNIKDLPKLNRDIVVVAQTTQTDENWKEITNTLKDLYSNIKVYNTICKATSERQSAAIDLAKEVDLMLVVGSQSSSNTMKLAKVCNNQGATTYQIESVADINKNWFFKNMTVGITAGASTPDWVLKEVIQMTEELLNEVNDLKKIEKGEVLKGTVTKIEDNQVTVDVGYKYEGIIPIGELSSLHIETANDAVKEGEQVEVEVLRINDEKSKMILSKKAVDSKNAWQTLQQKYDDKEILEVTVADVVKGGLVVDIGVRGFIPASHVERHFVEDFSDYKGRNLKVKIIEFDQENNKVILSQKVVLDEELETQKKNVIVNLEPGAIIEGTVQRITDFGAFVDIGGVDGLVHVSELAWYRVDHPSDVVKEGDVVKVKILSLDANNERISLSLKSAQPSPWDEINKKFSEGQIAEGIVKRLVSFGAFIELLPGVEGLVHISEISDKHIGAASDVLEVGQQITVKILDINTDEKRISLSIKQTIEPEPTQDNEIDLQKINETTTYTFGEMIGDKLKDLK